MHFKKDSNINLEFANKKGKNGWLLEEFRIKIKKKKRERNLTVKGKLKNPFSVRTVFKQVSDNKKS